MLKVLHVDDDAFSRTALQNQMGYIDRNIVVVSATSYRQARQIMVHEPEIGLAICEFQFSGRNDGVKYNPLGSGGLDFFEHIQRNTDIPFVYLSARLEQGILPGIAERGLEPPALILNKWHTPMPTLTAYIQNAISPKRPGNMDPRNVEQICVPV